LYVDRGGVIFIILLNIFFLFYLTMIKCVKTQEFKKFAQLLIAFITVTEITFCPGAIIARAYLIFFSRILIVISSNFLRSKRTGSPVHIWASLLLSSVIAML